MGKSRAQQHLNGGNTIQDNDKQTQFVPPLCNTCSSKNPVNLVCLNTKCEESQQLKAICPQCHASLFHSSVSLEIYIAKIKAIFTQSMEMIQLDRQKLLSLQESLNQLTFCLESMKQRTYEKLQEQENQYVRVLNTLKTITEVEQTKVPTAESLKDKVAQISKAVILDAKQDELNPVKIHLNFYQEFIDQCEMEIWVRFAKYFSHPKKDLGVKIEETEDQPVLEEEQSEHGFQNQENNVFKTKVENCINERNGIEQGNNLPSKSSDEIKSENEEDEEDDNEDDDDENDGDYNYRQNRRRGGNAAATNTNTNTNGRLKGGSFYLQNSSNNNNNIPNQNQSSAQENQAQNNCNETSSQSGSSEPPRGTHGTIRKIRELSQKEKQTILNEFDKTQDIRSISTKFNIKYRRLYNFIQNSRGPNNQSIRQYSDEDKQLIYNDYVDSKNVREVANKWKLNYDSLYSFIRYKKQK